MAKQINNRTDFPAHTRGDLSGTAYLVGHDDGGNLAMTPDEIANRDTHAVLSVPAAAWQPLTTNGAEATTVVYGSNEFPVLAFDASTEEAATFTFRLPDNYEDATEVRWSVDWDAAATASGTAVFGLSGVSFGNDNALSTALGTERTLTDTLIAVGDLHRSGNDATGITLAGSPVAGDLVQLKLAVKTSGTIAVDVYLLNLQLQYEMKSDPQAVWS